MALLPQCGTTEDAINFFGAFYAPISKNAESVKNRNVFLKKFYCAELHKFVSLNITLPFMVAKRSLTLEMKVSYDIHIEVLTFLVDFILL